MEPVPRMSETLDPTQSAIITDEETLLARVRRVLIDKLTELPATSNARLKNHLRELRDEAMEAVPDDLPRIFAEMSSVRALAERTTAAPLPDPDVPYFAHLRVKLATTGEERDYLLGRTSCIDTRADVRIVDWRFAPIARIFYGYREGDEFEEELPGGTTEGTVIARRVLVIERGQLTRIVGNGQSLSRDTGGTWSTAGLGAQLGGGSGTAARAGSLGTGIGTLGRAGKADITALLDPEQFAAIHTDPSRTLLVLGSAGSGKTTVALHRLARLAFEDKQRFPPDRLHVLVPEEGLSRLAKRLLEPLGLSGVRVETVGKWLNRRANEQFGVRKLRLCLEAPPLVTNLKRHPALKPILVDCSKPRAGAPGNFMSLRRELLEFFTDRALLKRVVDAANGSLPTTVIEATVRHSMQQLATPLSKELGIRDPDLLQTFDGQSLEAGTPEELAGTTDVEDLALHLFLEAHAGRTQGGRTAHLVLDEAEDFSLFELGILAAEVGRKGSSTLAGDEMQQTHSSFAGWDGILESVGAKKPVTCRLNVAYRCPRPIAELAQHVLGNQAPLDPAKAGRDGAPVGFHHFPDEAQSHLFLADALRDLVDREPNASIGVVASDPEAARRVASALASVPRARLVLDGAYTFDPGIDVCDVSSVKGLEFDYVVVPDATAFAYPDDADSRRRLHVAVTRASHQLWVMSNGQRSRVLPAG